MIEYIDAYRDCFRLEAICCTLRVCVYHCLRLPDGEHTGPVGGEYVGWAAYCRSGERLRKQLRSVYGVRTMWKAMQTAGWNSGRDQSARLMKPAGTQGRRRGAQLNNNASG